MQWFQTSYSMWFNRKRGRVGPLFQGRFNAVVVEPNAFAHELSRYVHLNPVRVKGLGLNKQARRGARMGLTPAASDLGRNGSRPGSKRVRSQKSKSSLSFDCRLTSLPPPFFGSRLKNQKLQKGTFLKARPLPNLRYFRLPGVNFFFPKSVKRFLPPIFSRQCMSFRVSARYCASLFAFAPLPPKPGVW